MQLDAAVGNFFCNAELWQLIKKCCFVKETLTSSVLLTFEKDKNIFFVLEITFLGKEGTFSHFSRLLDLTTAQMIQKIRVQVQQKLKDNKSDKCKGCRIIFLSFYNIKHTQIYVVLQISLDLKKKNDMKETVDNLQLYPCMHESEKASPACVQI